MTLEGSVHVESTSSISYFPDGKKMVSGASDKTVREWDLQTEQPSIFDNSRFRLRQCSPLLVQPR
ncbi:hypothetical protein AZE42_10416 [Rhizopogon vesiculosus]|uniref:Uncharacterized protein n=1 Tax=Rhizopogon vesiculosus TaxID=180088 RepID=A0A1J8QEY0_9AGAM|nr:hypothetical protein AZE42_10416 [Rhizopogon vesiculosus]